MFVDVVKINIRAGDGGNGSVHFLRDKHHIAGGPDGGNGGRGGHIYFVADEQQTSLVNFYYTRKYVAENGGDGGGQNCNGGQGKDVIIKVPRGTIVRDAQTDNIIADVVDTVEPVLVLRGGKGGRGNSFFARSTMQTPAFSELGEDVQTYKVVLELKLIADVGLIGLPNVGKSSLLSVISNATPKIANYHFTTLSPNLGVVKYHEKGFVVADIPGLIEGASQGAGLGHDFLRHIERTRLLVHVVDIAGLEGDPYNNYLLINAELAKYSEKLANKPMIIALNKSDLLMTDSNTIEEFKSKLTNEIPIVNISTATRSNIKQLLDVIGTELSKLPTEIESEEGGYILDVRDDTSLNIYRQDNGIFVVEGGKIDSLVRTVVLSDNQSFAYFQKRLRNDGIIDKLREAGAVEGDEIHIRDIVFTLLD